VDEYDDDWLMQERYARLEVKAGFYQQAEKRYLRIIKNEPKAYTSKLSVALLRLERDDFARAEQLLKDLKEVPQYRSTALYYLGISAQEQNHLKQAKSTMMDKRAEILLAGQKASNTQETIKI